MRRRQPDHAKYPSMKLAYASGRAGGTMTGVMSAANEQVGGGGLRACVDWEGLEPAAAAHRARAAANRTLLPPLLCPAGC